MSIWLCRAGRNGEHESKFLEEGKIYFTFEEIDIPITSIGSKVALKEYFMSVMPSVKIGTAQNWATQGYYFACNMTLGDWVLLPSKISPIVHIGKIISDYSFDKNASALYRHSRSVDWFTKVPRGSFDQEIQAALKGMMTIYKLKQEERIKQSIHKTSPNQQGPLFENDLESESLENISNYIIKNFKGHGLSHIIAAILRAKGFEVLESKAGPDHGVDILASYGNLGFDSPKICVQVKSAADAIERTVLDQLIGTMSNIGAEYGLLVSWGGFKQSIVRETAMQFFKVRLWSASDVIKELLLNYDKLDNEIKKKIPLKRIWILDTAEL